jgi:hypothetical protein
VDCDVGRFAAAVFILHVAPRLGVFLIPPAAGLRFR